MSEEKSLEKEKADGAIEYPEADDSGQMARAAREALNQMTDEEVEDRIAEAMARIYGGRSAQQAPGA